MPKSSSSVHLYSRRRQYRRQEISEHVSGAGAENGADRARKSDERERDLKKIRWSGSGRSRERERSGERAESAARTSLLKPNN